MNNCQRRANKGRREVSNLSEEVIMKRGHDHERVPLTGVVGTKERFVMGATYGKSTTRWGIVTGSQTGVS